MDVSAAQGRQIPRRLRRGHGGRRQVHVRAPARSQEAGRSPAPVRRNHGEHHGGRPRHRHLQAQAARSPVLRQHPLYPWRLHRLAEGVGGTWRQACHESDRHRRLRVRPHRPRQGRVPEGVRRALGRPAGRTGAAVFLHPRYDGAHAGAARGPGRHDRGGAGAGLDPVDPGAQEGPAVRHDGAGQHQHAAHEHDAQAVRRHPYPPGGALCDRQGGAGQEPRPHGQADGRGDGARLRRRGDRGRASA